MKRLATGLALMLAAALVPATGALAAPSALPAVKRSLSASGTTSAVCHDRLRSGRGIARASYRAPMSGFVTIRGAATRGNWDLAVFDARTRHAMTSSESFRSNEVAQTYVGAGQKLLIQGCRESGKPSAFRIATTFVDAKPPADSVPSLVRVHTHDQGVLTRLESLGFDVTHSMRRNYADVIAPSAGKLDLLEKAGLKYDLLSSDLRQDFMKARSADARQVAKAGKSPLPTGRETYRTYADYQTELAALVKDHPGLVKPITLGQTYQGRDIQGIEVASNVEAKDDGRPTYLLVALHHAREWPSAEIAMEFAHMIVDGFGSDEQITNLLNKERVVIVPIVNVDGFLTSRGTDPDPADSLMNNGASLQDNTDGASPYDFDTVEGVFVPFGGNLAYRRKNCDGLVVPNGPGHEEQNFPCYYQNGVDPNRNYGFGWGGLGASTDPNTQSYRGSGQWSEPETQAVWHFSQTRNISMLITLHNVAALVLRPPGQHTDGLAPDEARMKELGDKMADATGYTSQYGWQLYDTTGTTEDWTYGAQGSFGYTIEIGPEGGKFHMPYETGVVKEWTGYGNGAGRGMREALLDAAESAGNPGDHSVVEGAAQPGAVLKLSKKFDTFTSPICSFAQGQFTSGSILSPLDCVAPGDRTSTPDHLTYTTVVPASGQYQWHVPPSTRPFVFRHVTPGQLEDKPYEPATTWDAQEGDLKPDRWIDDNTGAGDDETAYAAERKFSVSEDNTQLVLSLTWDAPPQDFDLKLYHVTADGKLEPAGDGSGAVGGSAGSSGNPNGVDEQITVPNAATGDYVARVIYYQTGASDIDPSLNDWHMTLERYRKAPDKVETGREEYTLTCENPDGSVLDTRSVYVERGGRATENLCGGVPAADAGAGSQGRSESGVLGDKKSSAKPKAKKLSKRAACLKKASKIKSKKRRSAAVKKCKKRYPTKAERRAAAKRKAAAKKRAAAKRRAAHRHR